jgi:hypothetical protein
MVPSMGLVRLCCRRRTQLSCWPDQKLVRLRVWLITVLPQRRSGRDRFISPKGANCMLALHPDLDVVIGVDTHNDTHTAAAVGATGAVLEHLTVPADPAGYRQLIGFGRRHGGRLWAIEGTGSFGAGLTTALHACCERVVAVDRPQRPARRGGVKSDDIDALRAARQALAGVGLSVPRRRGEKPSGCCWPPARKRSRSGPGPSRPCMRWSPAPPTVFASGSGPCR